MNLASFIASYSRARLALAMLMALLSGLLNTALLGLIAYALQGGFQRELIQYGFIACALLLPLSRYSSEMLLNRLGQQALLTLRMDLSRKILSASLRQIETLGPHRLLASLTEDIPVITATLQQLSILGVNVVVVAGGLVYMGWLSISMFVCVFGFFLFGMGGYQLAVLRASHHFKQARDAGDDLMKGFHALTHGTKELTLNTRRRAVFFADMLEKPAVAYEANTLRGMRIHLGANAWGQGLAFATVGVSLFLLPRFVSTNAATLAAYVLVLLYLMTPLQVLMSMTPALSRANLALRKLAQLGLSLGADSTRVTVQEVAPGFSPGTWQRIELVDVQYHYRRPGEERAFVIAPMDLTIERGTIVFLVGGNGSGKTTLAKLLTGLYQPTSGEIRIDGIPVTEHTMEHYRQLFSAVFYDFFLFERLLGAETEALRAEAQQCLVDLHLDSKVRIEDGVLSTTELSQGQRRRLALLHVYIENRDVLLFDEWAADQDVEFKEYFYRQLLPALKNKGKTIIAISHDEKFYSVADVLLKMENGKLAAGAGHLPARSSAATGTGAQAV